MVVHLIGGETAENGQECILRKDMILAGFTVGIVDKKKIVTGEKIEAGHVLWLSRLAVIPLGMRYALVRKSVIRRCGNYL